MESALLSDPKMVELGQSVLEVKVWNCLKMKDDAILQASSWVSTIKAHILVNHIGEYENDGLCLSKTWVNKSEYKFIGLFSEIWKQTCAASDSWIQSLQQIGNPTMARFVSKNNEIFMEEKRGEGLVLEGKES